MGNIEHSEGYQPPLDGWRDRALEAMRDRDQWLDKCWLAQHEVVRLRDQLEGAVEALHEAIAAARTFNRGGMTWLEYDAVLAGLAADHPLGGSMKKRPVIHDEP